MEIPTPRVPVHFERHRTGVLLVFGFLIFFQSFQNSVIPPLLSNYRMQRKYTFYIYQTLLNKKVAVHFVRPPTSNEWTRDKEEFYLYNSFPNMRTLRHQRTRVYRYVNTVNSTYTWRPDWLLQHCEPPFPTRFEPLSYSIESSRLLILRSQCNDPTRKCLITRLSPLLIHSYLLYYKK